MHKNLKARGALAALALVFFTPVSAQHPPVKAAWVYVSPVAPTGWTRQHDEGRKAVEAALGSGVQTTFVESVPEGPEAERVIRDLTQQGHQIIFTPSFGFMEPTLKVAKEFPGVKFESITGFKRAENVATANARYYEGRYLAGVAAGRTGTSLGYLAGFPIPEVLQGINAFALGARSVNPKAQVNVVFLGEWFNPPKEREAAGSLFNQGVEVLAFHTGSAAPMAAAQERGKLAIGYHSSMAAVGPEAQLLAVTHDWGGYYAERVRAVQAGTWKSQDVWASMASTRGPKVSVGHFGPKLPAAVQREVLALQKRMVAGKFAVFAGGKAGVRDQTGQERIAPGQVMQDAHVLMMDWLAQGVVGSTK